MKLSPWFTPIPTKVTPANQTFWWGLSLAIALLYGIPVLHAAFANPTIVQDDARQHVFWMGRFLDPSLFPQDLIADYFQSVAPAGYTALYHIFAQFGIEPLLLSKLLPIAIGLIASLYAFQIAVQFLDVPFTGFIASLLMNQVIWSQDDVASASPRAFLPAIFLIFLYYLLKRSLLPVLGAIGLASLFYPQYVLVFAGIVVLQPLQLRAGKLRFSQNRQDYRLCGLGLLTAFLALLPYGLTASEFGPAITRAEAQNLAEFYPGGRSQFFTQDAWKFWITGERSGIFPRFMPPGLAIGFLLPGLLRSPQRFSLVKKIHPEVDLLTKLSLVAIALFGIAHVLLFRLHLPSRYPASTLRFMLVFATAIALTVLLDAAKQFLTAPATLRHGRSRPPSLKTKTPILIQKILIQKILILGLVGCISVAYLLYPHYTRDFPKTNYLQGETPKLYAFLRQQPPETVVASLLRSADFIPTFAQRSLFVGREYAIPYHKGYGDRFRQRVNDLILAQYTNNVAVLQQFLRQYRINFWLVSRKSFQPDFLQQNWTKQYPIATQQAIASLRQGGSLLQSLHKTGRCTVFQEQEFQLLDSACIQQSLSGSATLPTPPTPPTPRTPQIPPRL